ncbi:MAG: hypothetical protein DCF27_02655 [Lysobacteraceae bacterium]|nr:MAG: hypothetical protein DCF27_02655 [Xanthomonadaceae bacterium]
MAATINLIVAFLRNLGLGVDEGEVPDNTFLPGLRITAGAIVFDRRKLHWAGDLLHEAGHLAMTPSTRRGALSDDLADQENETHAGEAEATAWAYAATVALGLTPDVLFHPGGYHGKSQALIATYGAGVYPGCRGLSEAGMALIGEAARLRGLPPYPHMLRWLRE